MRSWHIDQAERALAGTSRTRRHRRAAAVLLLAVALSACDRNRGDQPFNGYAEAEFTRVAAPVAGRIVALAAQRGADIASGALLFTIEQTEGEAQVQSAKARLARAKATQTDLSKGQRPDEIAQAESSLQAARASARRSEDELERQSKLAHDGFISTSSLVDFKATRDSDAARVRELEAALRTARLGARADQQAAAHADVQQARADLAQTEWRFGQTLVQAVAPAHVDDTLFRVGEWVPEGTPVVSLLEPGAVKIRFFVPEPRLSTVPPGTVVRVTCDGCGDGVKAHVHHVASSAEFTPPVVYSQTNNPRLVFMVEARLDAADAGRLRPGLPVQVHVQ